MNRLLAMLKLTRIEHSLMLIIAVAAAELISGGIPTLQILLLSFITPALVSMGAFAINDYYDVGTDKANRRMNRPIVAGAISRTGARNVAMACFAIGIAASIPINAYALAIAAIFAALSYLYSYKLKDLLLVGNAYVAFSMVIVFIFGDLVVSNFININIILICFIIFASGLAREIHGMIRDRAGDIKVRGAKNLIRYIGVKRSATFALMLYVEAIVISVFLFFYLLPFRYNLVYLVLVMIADALLAYVAAVYMIRDDRKSFDRARDLSLLGMGVALLAYLVAPLFYVVV